MNARLIDAFIDITKKLNENNIIPGLYGSLGLSLAIGSIEKIDDVDFLLREEFLTTRWEFLKRLLTSWEYTRDPDHSHEFSKDGVILSFESFENLFKLSGINPSQLTDTILSGSKFKLPSAEQFLQIYRKCLNNDARKKKKEKADTEKITMIIKYLNQAK